MSLGCAKPERPSASEQCALTNDEECVTERGGSCACVLGCIGIEAKGSRSVAESVTRSKIATPAYQ